MTCHHKKGDPGCSSTPGSAAHNAIYRRRDERTPKTPDSAKFEFEEVMQVGPHLIAKVRYPNCNKCSFEGVKVMVWLNVTPTDALRWRKIDPHFTDPKGTRPKTEAPGPAARFPASADGWADAQAYAKSKAR